ncbi:hypothetical protein GCM10011488_11130 [Steroidobacter agaridevorans]|nr:hypothetical protein GCM10011488_11130 [Steroidobacter agaridevorans]
MLTPLEDDGKAPLILRDLAIVRGDTVQSFQCDSVYYVGSVAASGSQWPPGCFWGCSC